jgi:hypothetical protein
MSRRKWKGRLGRRHLLRRGRSCHSKRCGENCLKQLNPSNRHREEELRKTVAIDLILLIAGADSTAESKQKSNISTNAAPSIS